MDRTSKKCQRNYGESKENLQFDDQSKQIVFLFFLEDFSKINKHALVFLSSYRNTPESWENLNKVRNTHLSACVPTAISRSRYLIRILN